MKRNNIPLGLWCNTQNNRTLQDYTCAGRTEPQEREQKTQQKYNPLQDKTTNSEVNWSLLQKNAKEYKGGY